MLIIEIVKFLFFLLIGCLIPGLVLNSRLLKKDSSLKQLFLGLITGTILLTITFYITSLLQLRIIFFVYILLFLLFFFRLKLLPLFKINRRTIFLWKIKLPDSLDKQVIIAVLLIILGVIFQNIPTFKSGLTFSFGMGFWGPNTHDGIWHVSLINQLIKNVPPENPIFAQIILKNYHYLYDLLVAATAFFTKIPVLDLVFRFYPILFSLLLGIGTYLLANALFKKNWAVIFSLYFVYFAGSFGWIVDFIKNKSFGGESAFWANQSISYNLNPPFAVSLPIIIAIFLLLNNRKLRGEILIISMLAGSLVGFKAYGAVLVLSTLLPLALINIFKKDFSYLYISISSTIFGSLVFFSNFQISQQLIIFSPFWLIHSMIDAPDRVGWVRLTLARETGLQTGNLFKFILAEVISVMIFIVGNLGTRVLAIFSFLKMGGITKNDTLLSILIFSTLSILIPILFIQAGNPWNTIQFLYYGLYTTALVSGSILSKTFLKLPKFLIFFVFFLILVLTPINSIATATYYSNYLPHGRVDPQELEALSFLSKMEEGVVLTYPYQAELQKSVTEPWPLYVYDSTSYVSALSNKASYLEDEGQNQILLTDYKKRLVASKDFFLMPESNFLKENNIKYLYLPKIFNAKLSADKLPIRVVFENNEVIIYEVM